MLWYLAYPLAVGVAVGGVVYWYYHAIGLAIFIVLFCGGWNVLWRMYLGASPRTKRQIPPHTIRECQQLSAQQLSVAYREGTLSVVETVTAYIEHIKFINPYINVMVFDCFDEAMETARKADKIWAEWRRDRTKPMPHWLLGVPCTIKECMECRGCPNASGHPGRRDVISAVDSPVVHNFREAGAVILGVTNTSELCMWYESSNYVYGVTCNPYDTRCIVGGSSGGEGAAAASAFSTFSLGSDIGGSIRMPAFFNGVYGHKASPHFISNSGQHPGAISSANHYMATGPISRFPEDIIPLCKVAARGGFGRDPIDFPQSSPLNKVLDMDVQTLRIYALEDFGLPFIKVGRSQIDAVHMAAEALREQYGAKVTYINVRDPSRCTGGVVPEQFKPFAKILSMWSAALTTDPTETSFRTLMEAGTRVNWVAEFGRWLVGRSEHTVAAIGLCVLESLERQLPSWMVISDKSNLLPFKESLEALLKGDGIIITPSFPCPAPRHHAPLRCPFQFQYTAAFNVLQLPATACPIWSPSMLGRRRAAKPLDCRRKQLPADYHLPKGVQIVSATNQDELCVSTAIALDKALGGYRYPGWALLEGDDGTGEDELVEFDY